MLLCRVDVYISILALYEVGKPLASFIQVYSKGCVYIYIYIYHDDHLSAEIKRVSYSINLLERLYVFLLDLLGALFVAAPAVTVDAHHFCYFVAVETSARAISICVVVSECIRLFNV